MSAPVASEDWFPPWYSLQHTSDEEPFIQLPTKTGRSPVYITKFFEGDAETLHETLSLDDVNLALISVPRPYTLYDAKGWIATQRAEDGGDLPLQVLRADDPKSGKLIGAITLTRNKVEALQGLAPSAVDECELGYYLHPDYWRKGIMTDAVRAVMAWAVTEIKLESVVIRAAENNLGSRAVVNSFPQFEVIGEDFEITYPASKGGEKKIIRSWRWKF